MHKCRYTPSKPFWTWTLAESQVSHCKTWEAEARHSATKCRIGVFGQMSKLFQIEVHSILSLGGKSCAFIFKKKQVSSFMGLACWFRSWCYGPSMEGSHAQDGAKTRSASDASLALAIRMACARSWRPAVSSSDIVQNRKTHMPCPIPQPQ